MDRKKVLINSLSWGFVLWLIGYILGIIFFMIMPANMIGWVITPIATIITLWVLFKKITREKFTCYIGLGIIWTVTAIVLDYIFKNNIKHYMRIKDLLLISLELIKNKLLIN